MARDLPTFQEDLEHGDEAHLSGRKWRLCLEMGVEWQSGGGLREDGSLPGAGGSLLVFVR